MNTSVKYWETQNENIHPSTRLVINEFLLSIKLENKAESTIRKYCWVLEQFFTSCQVPLTDLTSEDVQKWLYEFSLDKKPRTIDLFLSALSSFFQFCLDEEYMEQTVIKKRWRPKIPQSLPKYLTEQEYARVKHVAEEMSLRDRALILFLFTTGCRRSEVSSLSMEDINLNKRTAKVIGKGKKIRHVHFSEECSIVLKEYLRTRSTEGTEPLFLNRRGSRLQPKAIYEITKKLGKKAGLHHILHPHCCRHTFATNMLARGADLTFLADEMGHKDLNTTRIYARIPTEDMVAAYQNIMG